MTYSVTFWCHVLFNDFATKHIVESRNWDGMWEKSVCQTNQFKISICIWLSVQYSHWYVVHLGQVVGLKLLVNTYKNANADGCLFVRVRTIEITECIVCSVVLNQLWLIYSCSIWKCGVCFRKNTCVWRKMNMLNFKINTTNWVLHSNDGKFWMVNCTFHIDHDMFCFFWWQEWQMQDVFGCHWSDDMFNIKILFYKSSVVFGRIIEQLDIIGLSSLSLRDMSSRKVQ
jgi:hypothetical protein